MHVNRLNHLIFPPATPSVTGGLLDAASTDTEAQDTMAGVATATAAPRAHRAASVEVTAPAAADASVKLELNASQRARAAVTYGPDGMFAGKSSVEVANTPAERFVASAVDIMRAYEQAHPQPAAQSPLGRLKQAVSRFSAQA